jgi:hypothetical protein
MRPLANFVGDAIMWLISMAQTWRLVFIAGALLVVVVAGAASMRRQRETDRDDGPKSTLDGEMPW